MRVYLLFSISQELLKRNSSPKGTVPHSKAWTQTEPRGSVPTPYFYFVHAQSFKDKKYSQMYRDFTNKCLKKEPEKRPDVKELLKHKLIKSAKKTNIMMEVIERYRRYKEVVPDDEDDQESGGDKSASEEEDASDEWVFNTVSISKDGQVKGNVGVEKEGKEEAEQVEPPAQPQQSAALTSVIYPALSKLLDDNISSATVANLKIAFDNAEMQSPGITENLIINIIDILKK